MNTKANIGKILLAVFMVLITGGQVTAIDNFFVTPTCITPSYDFNGVFTVTENTNGDGNVSMVPITSGIMSPSNVRVNNGNAMLCAISDPTTIGSLSGEQRVFGSSEDGNIWYVDVPIADYSTGFHTNSNQGGQRYHIGNLTAATGHRHLAIDSSGNVYTYDGVDLDNLKVIKFVKSLDYSQQLIHTVTNAESLSTTAQRIIDIAIDSNDRVHVLVVGVTIGTYHMTDLVLDTNGNVVYQWPTVLTSTVGGTTYGSIIPDATNPLNNFTYSYNDGTATYLKHNSSTGTVDVAGGSMGAFSIMGKIAYNNFQIYIPFPTQNFIRSYATNFQGFVTPSSFTSNPNGITGTFTWLNGYQAPITSMTPGQALAYRATVSNLDTANFTFFTGWAVNTATPPSDIHDIQNIVGLPMPNVFITPSTDLAGTTIYGYLLSKRNNDSTWYFLTSPVALQITGSTIGFDSITLDKVHYNLTGDTINAAFTYSSTLPIWFYQWQVCSRVDCADGYTFEANSLIGQQPTGHIVTTGLAQGNYYAVMMRHLPFLSNTIVNYKQFDVRPPVIGVSWDKPKYNLIPKSQVSSCLDATPTFNPWSNISGYAGLQTGWFSCSTTSASADANNSIMRGSLYARFNGTFYLNNSFGSVWNGTLNNGSGALIYSLTNSSVTQTWTLVGVNQSGETFYANVEVVPESRLGYSLSVSPNPAFNTQTLLLAFTHPIFVSDHVEIKDAGGMIVAIFKSTDVAGSYYIDPAKQYTYGTWTAYWNLGSTGIDANKQGHEIYTFVVRNAGRPVVNGSIVAENSPEYTSSQITDLLSSKIFWALLFIVGIMLAVAVKERGGL